MNETGSKKPRNQNHRNGFKDITGHRFGKLVALQARRGEAGSNIHWECICDCGNVKLIQGSNLRSGNITSCGCLLRTDPSKIPPPEHGTKNIPLTRGKWAVIDESDYDLVNEYTWYSDRKGYAATNYTRQFGKISLHRFLIGDPPGHFVDHKDGNPSNNKRSNLRLSSEAQNAWNSKISTRNTSGYKGVSKRGEKWRARIRVHGKLHHLGDFNDPSDAHASYCEAAKRLHGEFHNPG